MNRKALHNFMLFLFDLEEEDIEEIEEELNHAGIDPDKSQKDIQQKLKKARAELKVEKGKKIFKKYREEIKNKLEGYTSSEDLFNELAVEFRKLENLEDNDINEILDEAEKMEILKRIIEEEEKE